jgi:hypothetical protein
MSGTTLMRKAMTAEEEEKSYSGVLEALEIKGGSTEEHIKALLETPVEKFLTIPRSVGWAWCVDGDFVDKTPTHAELAALSGQPSAASSAIPAAVHVKDLVLGDCQLDVSSLSLQLDFTITIQIIDQHLLDFHCLHVPCPPQAWNGQDIFRIFEKEFQHRT